MIDLVSYVNKTVEFKFMGAELRFDLSHALFSSFDIDLGTRLLLKTVARDPVLATARRILDEGCGVGVIGLAVAKAFPDAELTLRDRDSLAVAFAERNRLANKLRDTTAWTDPGTGAVRKAKPAPQIAWGLLGDGREGGPYDFVLSNLPAKAGAPVLAAFFARLAGKRGGPGGALLAPGGRAGLVIVNPLAEAAAGWIAEAGLVTVAAEQGSGHRVFVVERPGRPSDGEASPPGALPLEALPRADAARGRPAGLDRYVRGESRFSLAGTSFRASGFWGLPEFDTPDFGSAAVAEAASRRFAREAAFEDALFIEPGIGLVPIWAVRELGVRRVTAASRDALALEATRANLASLPESSRPAFAAVDALAAASLPRESFDLLVEAPDVVPELDWIGPSWERAELLVRPGGVYVARCGLTEATRLEKRKPAAKEGRPAWSLVARRRKKGAVALAWRRS